MKCIAAITADLQRSPLGTRSRLGDDLLGECVLRRTVRRALEAHRLDSVHVLVHERDHRQVAATLEGLDVRLEAHTTPPPPYAALVRAGRLWGLDGWRGGIGGLCAFDEDVHVVLAASLAQRTEADAVACIPAAAPLIDPAFIDALVDHFQSSAGAFRMAIVQAPPGLGLVVFGRALLEELAPSGQPPGVLLGYHPDRPGPDLTGRPPCYRPPAEVIEARGRLLCDTRRSFERLHDLVRAGAEGWGTPRIARWLSERGCSYVEPVPEEIEIELTTQDPLAAGSILRPRGQEVGPRGPIDLETIRAIGAAIEGYDDVRFVLGGFGEPLCHPQFTEVCRILRSSGALALAVRTNAVSCDPGLEAALFETPLDVVEVTLDAATPATYRAVHGADLFDEVTARVERWLARRLSAQQVVPLIVPSFVKAGETLQEMELFFDTWQRRLGTAVITGYSNCAGQRPTRAVTSTTPPQRGVCRRVFKRILILADGTVATCDQDFAARQTLGSLRESPLGELWRSDRLAGIRSNELAGLPLCPTCDQWHGP
jgi:MoaA/NifB/PqqE/SkfB family radical SAM enzyme